MCRTRERCVPAARAGCGAATNSRHAFLGHFRRFCPIYSCNNPFPRRVRDDRVMTLSVSPAVRPARGNGGLGIFGGWGKHLTRPGAGQAPRPTTLHARTPGRSSFAAGARASARDEELSHVLVSATLPRSMWRQQHGWRAGGGRRAAFTSPSLCAWRGVHARGRAPAAKPNRARRRRRR